jgi:DNA polymerase III sliding clamp (beta) subunit (PCNA family)
MKTYIIKHNELEAIALASSTEASRYYLCGVLIEPLEDGTVALVATDGHRLSSLRYAPQNPAAKDSFILASDDIKKIVSMAKAEAKTTDKQFRKNLAIKIEKEGVNLTLSIVLKDGEDVSLPRGSFTTKEVDGNFPDYARVIPSCEDSTTTETSFNADYMADFGKMAKLITGSRFPQIALKLNDANGPMKIIMPHNSEFLGVLMPMRV